MSMIATQTAQEEHAGREDNEIDRIDSLEKVTGRTKFFSDVNLSNMLHASVLRTKYPHARILRIDTSKAEKHPGVVAVVTHNDIPGEKHHGLMVGDQPILCWDKVRYIGDALVAVAAESKSAAEEALDLVGVDYEPLPLVTDPEKAMQADSVKVHDKGNVCRHARITVGDVEAVFHESDFVVKNVFYTGRQMQMHLEIDSGVAYIDKEGVLVVACGGQAPYATVFQISRSLKIPQDKVRVIHTPAGGAFGAKIDTPIAIILALLAMKSRRPVKMVWSREESGRVGAKRHPMKITITTGVKKDGTLLANKVALIGDTGAYTSFANTVLDVAMEVSVGPYRWKSVDIEGFQVFTNNGVAGAFRGFGAPQANFALESQLDIIAEKLGIDKIEFRKKNVLKHGDRSVWGHIENASVGALQTLERGQQTELWRNKDILKRQVGRPWIQRGVGVSLAMKGVGYGAAPDSATASITLTEKGRFIAGVTCPELGQGNTTVYAQIASQILGCGMHDIEVVSGDTGLAPNTGSATASKGLYVGGSAVKIATEKMVEYMTKSASEILKVDFADVEHDEGRLYSKKDSSISISYEELAGKLHSMGRETRVDGKFDVPRAKEAVPGSLQIPHMIHSFATTLALVDVDTLTGVTKVRKLIFIAEAGKIINRQNFLGQCLGGMLQGLGYGLTEDTLIEDGIIKTHNFTTYITPAAGDIPEMEVISIDSYEETGPFGAKGVSELPIVPIASAICNAIHDATGTRIERIPATPERVFEAMKRKEGSNASN